MVIGIAVHNALTIENGLLILLLPLLQNPVYFNKTIFFDITVPCV